MTVPMPLKACDKLMRISAYLGGPQTTPTSTPQNSVQEAIGLTSDEGVSRGLERSQAVSNDEDANTEAREALGLDARNRDQGTDSIEAEAPDENSAIAIVSQDPSSVADGCQGIGTGHVSLRPPRGRVWRQTQSRQPGDQTNGPG